MKLSVEIKKQNLDKVIKALQADTNKKIKRLDRFLSMTFNRARNEILFGLNKKGTGATYKRGNVFHTASAPYMSPTTDKGNLASSIHFIKTGLELRLSAQTDYARNLEYGTKRIAPRPFITYSVLKAFGIIKSRKQSIFISKAELERLLVRRIKQKKII